MTTKTLVLPKRTPADLAVPSLEDLAAGFTIPRWLASQVTERLRSQSMFARVSGVGLVARAWACGLEAPGDLWRRLQAGELDPTARAETWARSLTEPTLRETLSVFAGRVASFEDRLASMEEAYEGRFELEEAVARLVEERDDIACVLWVLSRTSARVDAEEILGGLDAFAATHHLAVESISDPTLLKRLYAIAEVEPDRWWVRSLQ